MSDQTALSERSLDERTQLIELEDKFDVVYGERLAQRVIDLIYDGRRVFIIDLSRAAVDIRAVTPLLRAARRLSYRNGRLALVSGSTSQLADSGLDSALELAATQDEALAKLATSALAR